MKYIINSAQMCPWWMSARIQTSHTQRANDPRRLRVWTPANDTESCTQRHVFQPTPPPPHIDTLATLTKKSHCGRSGLGLAMVGKLGRNM